MLGYHSAIKIMFTQIALIAAIKRFLYNTMKNNTGIILSWKACFSRGGCRQPSGVFSGFGFVRGGGSSVGRREGERETEQCWGGRGMVCISHLDSGLDFYSSAWKREDQFYNNTEIIANTQWTLTVCWTQHCSKSYACINDISIIQGSNYFEKANGTVFMKHFM